MKFCPLAVTELTSELTTEAPFVRSKPLFPNRVKIPFFFLHICRSKDKIEMSLFIMRYISCLLIFMLGLKAPGLSGLDYQNLPESNEEDVSQ